MFSGYLNLDLMINSLIVRLAQSLGNEPNSVVVEEVRDGAEAGDLGSLLHLISPPLPLPTPEAGPLVCRCSVCVCLNVVSLVGKGSSWNTWWLSLQGGKENQPL